MTAAGIAGVVGRISMQAAGAACIVGENATVFRSSFRGHGQGVGANAGAHLQLCDGTIIEGDRCSGLNATTGPTSTVMLVCGPSWSAGDQTTATGTEKARSPFGKRRKATAAIKARPGGFPDPHAGIPWKRASQVGRWFR